MYTLRKQVVRVETSFDNVSSVEFTSAEKKYYKF